MYEFMDGCVYVRVLVREYVRVYVRVNISEVRLWQCLSMWCTFWYGVASISRLLKIRLVGSLKL